jgi:hypothetical protein
VPELPGAHTFAGSLRKLDRYVREAIVVAADLPDESTTGLELQYGYRLGDEALDARVRRIRARTSWPGHGLPEPQPGAEAVDRPGLSRSTARG